MNDKEFFAWCNALKADFPLDVGRQKALEIANEMYSRTHKPIRLKNIQEACYPYDPLPFPNTFKWRFYKKYFNRKIISNQLIQNGWVCLQHKKADTAEYFPANRSNDEE